MTPTRIIDLSVPITEDLDGWPGDAPIRLVRQGDSPPITSTITLGSHAGTHLDAPQHWFTDGATVETISLDRLIGPARVLDVRRRAEASTIGLRDLPQAEASAGERLLLLTGWRGRITDWSYPGLTREAAEWLLAQDPAVVGTDAPSIDGPNAGWAHELLLGAAVPVIESLTNLERLVGRTFTFVALPLPVVGLDGAPVRAVALCEA